VRLTARVPATSANLGPGFDCFGLALDLCNEVTVDTEAEPGVSWEGEGADELPTDGTDMVSRAMRHVLLDLRESTESASELPSFALHSVNRIPLQSGLGSSAAAVVAGVALATALLDWRELGTPLGIASLAGDIEGHRDNVTAAALGGFTIWGPGSVLRRDVHPGVRPVLLVPVGLRSSTDEARRILPASVPFADAVHNIGAAATLVDALTVDPRHIHAAVSDRLHQRTRLQLMPEVRVLFERLERVPLPVCVSGAGPSLLVFETDVFPDLVVPDPGEGWRVLRLPVRATGVEILEG
jgi:homoserine kinase